MNREVEMGELQAAGEPMVLANSPPEGDFSSINTIILKKTNVVNEVSGRRLQGARELREKLDKLRILKELKQANDSMVAGLEFREQEASMSLKQKQDSLEESRKEVQLLQQMLKQEKKIQVERLAKHEANMSVLSKKFVDAPIVNDAKALELELKVLQELSNEVQGQLHKVKQELQELMARYNTVTDTSISEKTVATEHNHNVFIKQVIHDLEAEVTREKKHCSDLMAHMKSLETTTSNMRRELDNIKSKH